MLGDCTTFRLPDLDAVHCPRTTLVRTSIRRTRRDPAAAAPELVSVCQASSRSTNSSAGQYRQWRSTRDRPALDRQTWCGSGRRSPGVRPDEERGMAAGPAEDGAIRPFRRCAAGLHLVDQPRGIAQVPERARNAGEHDADTSEPPHRRQATGARKPRGPAATSCRPSAARRSSPAASGTPKAPRAPRHHAPPSRPALRRRRRPGVERREAEGEDGSASTKPRWPKLPPNCQSHQLAMT